MNKRGVYAVLGIMFFILIMISAVVMIETIKTFVGIARDTNALDCNNESISSGQQMACIINDWQLPIFFLSCLGVAVGFIGMKGYGGD